MNNDGVALDLPGRPEASTGVGVVGALVKAPIYFKII